MYLQRKTIVIFVAVFLIGVAVKAENESLEENYERHDDRSAEKSDEVISREDVGENSREGRSTKVRIIHLKPRGNPVKKYKIWPPHKQYVKLKPEKVRYGMRRRLPYTRRINNNISYKRQPPKRRQRRPPPPPSPPQVIEYDYHVHEDEYYPEDTHQNTQKTHKKKRPHTRKPSVSYSNFVQHSTSDEYFNDEEPKKKVKRKKNPKKGSGGRKKIKYDDYDDQYGAYSYSTEEVAQDDHQPLKNYRRPARPQREPAPIYGEGYLGQQEINNRGRYEQQLQQQQFYQQTRPQNIQVNPDLINPYKNYHNPNSIDNLYRKQTYPNPLQQPNYQFSSQYSNGFDNTETYKDFTNNANFRPSKEAPIQQENDFLTKHLDFYSNGFKGVSVHGSLNNAKGTEEPKKDFDIGYGEIPYDESNNK